MSKFFAAIVMAVAAPFAAAQCVHADGESQNQNGVLVDDWTTAIPIGFAFPFNGATYTDMYLSDHSLCALNNAGTPAAPAGGAFVYSPGSAGLAAGTGPMIAPYWSDHTLSGTGEIYIERTATSCRVSWIDVQTYQAGSTFSVAMTLHSNGDIDFVYDGRVNNDGSTFGVLDAVIGIGDVGAALATPSDLSSGVATSPTIGIFEQFVTTASGTPNPNFDLADQTISFIATNPGWVAAANSLSPCATSSVYGSGCGGNGGGGGAKLIYENLPVGGFDIASGTTITYLRTPSSYLVTASITGTFVTPTAAAINIAPGSLDGDQPVSLSAAMPIPGGTTTLLNVCTKAYITLNGQSNGIDFTPTSAELKLWPNPTIAPSWHDYDQTAVGSGLILFEEVGGFAYVTWNGVYSFFGNSLPDTFQVQFELATGNITIVYQTMQGDGEAFTVGYTAGAPIANDPGAFDWSAAIPVPVEVHDSEPNALEVELTSPRIGGAWAITTKGIDPLSPISIAFFSDLPLVPGLPMTSIGIPAPGCDIHIGNVLGSVTGINAGGSSVVNLPIPNNSALAGVTLAVQSVCLTLQNPFNILTSNGGLGTIGY